VTSLVQVLSTLLSDEVISRARISPEDSLSAPSFTISKTSGQTSGHEDLLNGMELAAATEDKETHSFEIDPSQVENVKQRCLPNALNYPMLEEYDFRNDTVSLPFLRDQLVHIIFLFFFRPKGWDKLQTTVVLTNANIGVSPHQWNVRDVHMHRRK
jgi:hypothetical protein